MASSQREKKLSRKNGGKETASQGDAARRREACKDAPNRFCEWRSWQCACLEAHERREDAVGGERGGRPLDFERFWRKRTAVAVWEAKKGAVPGWTRLGVLSEEPGQNQWSLGIVG